MRILIAPRSFRLNAAKEEGCDGTVLFAHLLVDASLPFCSARVHQTLQRRGVVSQVCEDSVLRAAHMIHEVFGEVLED